MIVFGDPTENADWIAGDDGNDWIYGAGGNDLLMGGGGNDYLLGNHGDDTIVPGYGLDFVYGGFLDGDSGNDTVSYGNYTSDVFVDLTKGFGYQKSLGLALDKDTLYGIENAVGSAHDDVLGGNDVANKLTGNGGSDWLAGLGGNDSLYGGNNDDLLEGGVGADTLDGGSGKDFASYLSSNSRVVVNLKDGYGLFGDAQGDTLIGIEDVFGSGYDDVFLGNAQANTLIGIGGHDQIYGYEGNDFLDGGSGNDMLSGGANNDTLIGGIGKDTLTGGLGGDTFIFGKFDIVLSLANADVITDFSHAQGDKIDLTGVDGNEYIAGTQGFVFVPGDDFSGTPGEVCFDYINGNTIIAGNTDDDDDTDFIIVLTGQHQLTADDFIL